MEVLKACVTESLIAFPEEAHLKVFAFLTSAGATDAEKQRVQQAWSSVLLGSEAFGRKGKGPINPVLFGEELIRELASGDKELSRLGTLIAGFESDILDRKNPNNKISLTNLADLKKPSGTLAALQSLTKAGKELSAALDATYENSGALGGTRVVVGKENVVTVGKDKAIMEWRRSVRGGKFVWHGRKSANASTLFCPLGSVEHGGVEVSFGDVVYKNSEQTRETSSKPSTIPIIGVKIVTKQPSLLTRAWTSYQCLHEVLNTNKHQPHLFATPYGIQRECNGSTASAVSTLVCAFELPNCRPLTPLLSPALATFLRRYPSVVLTWCAQLGSAVRNLLNCSSGRLVRMPTVADCFIKDNGQLVLGNVSFESMPENDENGMYSHPSNDISTFVAEVLSTAMSLSRTHQVILVAASSNDAESMDQSSNTPSSTANEEVISVMEGCEVRLVFINHSCRGLALEVMGVSTNMTNRANETTRDSNRLNVLVQGEPGVASILHGESIANETFVDIKATSTGFVMFQISTPVQGGGIGEPNVIDKMRRTAAVRIIVVPAYPIMATELQEVISLAESAYTSRTCKYLLEANAFINTAALARDEITVMSDWTAVTRAVLAVISPSSTVKKSF